MADAGDGEFRLVSSSVVHTWAWWQLVTDEFVSPDGESFVRSWVRSPGAVGVVALDDDDRVVLVRQYRPALRALLWEIPAGLRDVPGEDPEDTARRELQEEVGLAADRLSPLCRIHSAPGISDSDVAVYLARDLRPVEAARHGPEERHMEQKWFPVATAIAMVDDGVITDSKTVAGLLHLARLG